MLPSTNQTSLAGSKEFELKQKGEDADFVENIDNVEAVSPIDEQKTLRKMDLHIIPILSLLYLLAFLDRGNIGNAKIEGLTEDLNLSGPQYSWCCK